MGVDVAIERVEGSRGIDDGVDLGVAMMEAVVIMAVVGAVLVCSSAEYGAVGFGKPWRKILWSPALAWRTCPRQSLTATTTHACQPQLPCRGTHTCTSGHVSTSITSLRHCPACSPYHDLVLVSGTAMQPTCSTTRASDNNPTPTRGPAAATCVYESSSLLVFACVGVGGGGGCSHGEVQTGPAQDQVLD